MGHQATRPLTCPIPPMLFSALRCNYPGTRHGWKCRMMDLEAPHLVVDAYQKPSAPVEQSRSISGEIWGHGCPPSLPLFRPQRFPAKPFRPIRPNSLHHYHGPTVWIFSASWIALDECRGYELWWDRWYQGIWLNMKVKEHDRLLKISPIFCCLPRLSHIFLSLSVKPPNCAPDTPAYACIWKRFSSVSDFSAVIFPKDEGKHKKVLQEAERQNVHQPR